MCHRSPDQQKVEQYFATLPAYIQETIKQSGTTFQTEQDLRQFVDNLNEKER